MIGRPTRRLSITLEQKKELEALARQKRKTRSVAFRAQIILKCSEGHSDSAVAQSLRTSNSTVGLWRMRFLENSLDGLFDEPRAGRRARWMTKGLKRSLPRLWRQHQTAQRIGVPG